MTKFLLCLLLGALTACTSAPAPRLSQAVEQANAADMEARRSLRDGQLLRAQQGFVRTLVLQQSLDDLAGSAITMINLATVTHQLNDDQAALAWLDKIVLEKSRIYPPESQLIASFRKSVILTNLSRLNEAESSLLLAENLCEKKCALRFGMDVLRARWLLLKGDAEGTLTLVRAVAKESAAGREEQANALRVAAAAEEKLLRDEQALKNFKAALDLDKLLGLSARIGEDLRGMARVSTKLGRDQEAEEYSRRAALVKEFQSQTMLSAPE